MGVQIGLFDRAPAPAISAPPGPAPVPPAPPPPPAAVDPRQSDLFGDRWLRASQALHALDLFDLDAADAALVEASARYPDDPLLRERASLVRALATELRAAGPRLAALLSLSGRVPDFVGAAWHRAVAREAEAYLGDGALVGGAPIGWHWLEGERAAEAARSLRATLAAEPTNARARACLGDALHTLGRVDLARDHYRDAFACDPDAVDVGAIRDPDVRALLAAIEYDHELSPPAEWVPAVGLLEGLFVARGATPPSRNSPGAAFYRALLDERVAGTDDARLACRRAMKAASPELFAVVMRRRA